MATGPSDDRLGDTDALLGNHQGIEAATADMPSQSATFTQRMANTAEELRPIANEPSGSLEPTSLLVADEGNYHVSGRRSPLGHESQRRHDHHRNPAFHVNR